MKSLIFLPVGILLAAVMSVSTPPPESARAQVSIAEAGSRVSVNEIDAAPRIVLADSYKVGEKIVVSFEGDTIEDAEASLHWTLPPTVQSEAGSGDGRRLLLWASPGLYDIQLNVSYSLDVMVPDQDNPGKSKVRKVTFPPYIYHAKLNVGGVVPPEPGPGPQPEPDKPLTGLAALIPDREKRHAAAEFYEDLALAAGRELYTSTSHFRTAYRAAIATAQASGELPKGLAPIDKPISDRIAAAIGLADVALDAAKRDALVIELRRIATELRQ